MTRTSLPAKKLKNKKYQSIARFVSMLPVVYRFRSLRTETVHAHKLSADVCLSIEYRSRSLIPILLLIILLSSCSENGVSVDEPVEEIIQDQELSLISSSPVIDRGNSRWKEVAATDLRNQRMMARSTVNVAGPGDKKTATAAGYARFSAKKEQAALLVDIKWKGTMLSAVNLSSTTEMTVNLRVREILANGSAGTVVFSRELDRDGIGSGLRAVQVLNVEDSIRDSYQLNNLKLSQIYRVEVELRCRISVDVVSLSVVDCNAFTADRGVFVEQLKVSY